MNTILAAVIFAFILMGIVASAIIFEWYLNKCPVTWEVGLGEREEK